MLQLHHKIAVIGGGISGLTAAYSLYRSGYDVSVYEAGDHLGGSIKSYREDGWLTEAGPNTLMVSNTRILDLIRDLGIEDEIVEANPMSNNRYIVRNNKLIPIPLSPAALISSQLFSLGQKLNILAEPLRSRSNKEDESLADFVRRRLGDEFLKYAIDPFVSGVYAGDPERLSVRYAFPKIYALEDKYGSLIKGQIRIRKERRSDPSRIKPRMISFRGGLDTIIHSLADKLAGSIHLNTSINTLNSSDDSWEIRSENDSYGTFDRVILTSPAYKLADMTINGHHPLLQLRNIEYPPVTSLALGFRRSDIKHSLNGFGMLIPSIEKKKILGSLFSSTLFPERAPEGSILLTTFIGGVRNPDSALVDDGELVRTVVKEMTPLLGITADPIYVRRLTWRKAIPQYTLGYGSYLDLMTRFEQENPGLHITGNYRGGISVPDCILSALKTTDEIMKST